jgi:hypothetical protein
MEAGTQLVIQSHYVNPTPKPIRVHDAIHVHTVAKEQANTLLGFYAHTDIGMAIKPGNDSTIFDCAVPHDMNILMAGPHMHEWGSWVTVEAGPADALKQILKIDKWDSEMRDIPPVSSFFDEPLKLKAGDIVRTHCNWENDQEEDLGFPEEMCAVYGYFYPVEDTPSWVCVHQ